MDPQLACIDPNLLQLNQLFEDVDEAVLAGAGPSNISDNFDEKHHQRHSEQFNIFQEPEDGHPDDDGSCLDLGPPKRPRLDEESSEKSNFLHFGSLREAESYIARTGQAQGVSFRKRKVPKNFGNSEWRSGLSKKKLFWDKEVAYIKAAGDVCIYECHRGADHDADRKTKRKLKNAVDQTRARKIGTKKVDCPMKIVMEERIYFPREDVKQEKSPKGSVRTLRAHLRKQLESDPEKVEGIRKIWLCFRGCHNHGSTQDSDPPKIVNSPVKRDQIIDIIHQLVWQGVEKTTDVRAALLSWMASDHKNRSSECQMVSSKDIVNHVSIAKNYIQNLRLSEESIRTMTQEWIHCHSGDLIFFKPFSRKQLTAADNLPSPTTHVDVTPDEGSETVVLTGESNSLLAFGKRVGAFESSKADDDKNWYKVTDVLEANAKLPASSSNGTGEIFLKPKMICQWPKHLVLNVVTEDSKQERVNLQSHPSFITEPLLFVYQSTFQRRLMVEFGAKVFFLDELCLAKRSHLTFYMLFVKTKVDFQPVAFIVCGLTTSKRCWDTTLVQGLKHLIANNPTWTPSYCICSSISETEIDFKSIEKSFPASLKVVVSDVAREQHWNDFFASSNLDQVAKDSIRNELERLAGVTNVNDFEDQAGKCRTRLENFCNISVTNYFESNWLKNPERWILVFACVKVLCRDKPWFHLDLDGNRKVSSRSTFARTSRLILVHQVLEAILKDYLPQEQERYLDLCNATSDDTQRNSSHCDVISGMTLDALKQIVLVLNEGQSKESLTVVEETLASTLGNLIHLLPNHTN